MALFSKREFSDRCGIETKVLSVYIKRGKVLLTGESIDDTLPQNQAFLNKNSGKPRPSIKSDKVIRQPSSSRKVKASKEVSKSFTLDLERKEIENERALLGKQLLQAKLGKQRGETIPFDDVKMALDIHFRDWTVYFTQGCRNLLVEISSKAKLNINQKAELNKSLEKIVNDSLNKTIDATIATLKKIQKDTSAKREVGEKAA